MTTGLWFPEMPPKLPGETADQYTDRLTGADGTGRRPYDHHRNRQCSIGYHGECSDPIGDACRCPCHYHPAPNCERCMATTGGLCSTHAPPEPEQW